MTQSRVSVASACPVRFIQLLATRYHYPADSANPFSGGAMLHHNPLFPLCIAFSIGFLIARFGAVFHPGPPPVQFCPTNHTEGHCSVFGPVCCHSTASRAEFCPCPSLECLPTSFILAYWHFSPPPKTLHYTLQIIQPFGMNVKPQTCTKCNGYSRAQNAQTCTERSRKAVQTATLYRFTPTFQPISAPKTE